MSLICLCVGMHSLLVSCVHPLPMFTPLNYVDKLVDVGTGALGYSAHTVAVKGFKQSSKSEVTSFNFTKLTYRQSLRHLMGCPVVLGE